MRYAILWALIGMGCGSDAPQHEETSTTATSGTERPAEAPADPPAQISNAPQPEPAEGTPSPPKPWAEMTHTERRRWMGLEVLPRMTDLFIGYDGERYADASCETCHGADADARNYEMPNPTLYRLYPTGSPEQMATVRDHQQMVRFMYNHVVPTMQRMTGGSPFDPASGTGFSCYSCHPRGESADPNFVPPPH